MSEKSVYVTSLYTRFEERFGASEPEAKAVAKRAWELKENASRGMTVSTLERPEELVENVADHAREDDDLAGAWNRYLNSLQSTLGPTVAKWRIER